MTYALAVTYYPACNTHPITGETSACRTLVMVGQPKADLEWYAEHNDPKDSEPTWDRLVAPSTWEILELDA